ncbi:two-component regulator propeller domain-containing protein, partial [Xanthovirga aplysinae]|uniref:two-component regulator propeller domain-containing protein n=1 Tax=Xanthovirga aplysinae TaxID=2529853 RepID=UPI0012BC6F76
KIFAHNYDYLLSHVTEEKGLSHPRVNAIAQDSTGFIWIGTFDGLNRYDGRKLIRYKQLPFDSTSISHSYITALLVDKKGKLWIGTKSGLNYYDPQNDRFFKYFSPDLDRSGLAHDHINDIYEDKNGKLWISTQGGLSCFNPLTEEFNNFFHNPENPNSLSHNNISKVIEDKEGKLWIGTKGGGLNCLEPQSGNVIHYINNGLPNPLITSILEDKSGDIWIGTKLRGLYRFDKETQSFHRFGNDGDIIDKLSSQKISSLKEDKRGNIWIGTNNGLNLYQPNHKGIKIFKHHNIEQTIIHNSVLTLMEDKVGNIWAGTSKGISRFENKIKKFNHYRKQTTISPTLNSDVIYSFFEENDSLILIGTEKGLKRFNRNQETFVNITTSPDIGNEKIGSIIKDHSNTIWLGTDRGLKIFDPSYNKITPFNLEKVGEKGTKIQVRYVFEDSDATLWLGTKQKGLIQISKEREIIKVHRHDPNDPFSISDNFIRNIFEDSFGNLWIGTLKGLNQFHKNKNSFTRFNFDRKNPHSISSEVITSIYEDSKGRLWIGTRGGGLNLFDRSKKEFIHFSEFNGLPNNIVINILEDSLTNLWVTTGKGLARFNPDSLTFKGYNRKDGLQENRFIFGATLKSSRGEFYFGGYSGFNLFHPNSILDNTVVPPLAITDFNLLGTNQGNNSSEIFRKNIAKNKHISLSHDQRFFTFEFVALDYSCPEKNKYAYKLEGFDKDWQHVGTRNFATYTGVPPGKYLFKVKGSNADGIWNEEGTTLELTISPSLWDKIYFRIIVFLLMIGGAFLWYRYRLNHMKTQKKELEKVVKHRTHEVLLQKEEIRLQLEVLEDVYAQLQTQNQNHDKSISYARQIQQAVLPEINQIKNVLPDSFIFFRPKDKVSGDFFWFAEKDNKIIIAAADCTGHGVPGALMSMTGSTVLQQVVHEKGILQANKILNELHKGILHTLRQDKNSNKDGMDIALCVINKQSCKVEFAGAKNPLLIIQNEEANLIKGDRLSIGGLPHLEERNFKQHEVIIDTPTTFYLFTDGYQDQFGGNKGRKFMASRLRKLLLDIHNEPMEKQQMILKERIEKWMKHNHPQIDDILILGFRLTVPQMKNFSLIGHQLKQLQLNL